MSSTYIFFVVRKTSYYAGEIPIEAKRNYLGIGFHKTHRKRHRKGWSKALSSSKDSVED